ncbi:MAG: alpha-hydroxy-acid oxidizing protein [Proteobacteria bacterium]|nr:alpha-hydroxy-acid oxidizing protein [Pseudomonadota bacterium]
MAALAAVDDYRALARRRLARIAFDYLDGGAEDGGALARNRAAFAALRFEPRVLRDVREVDTGVELFGRRQAWPVLVGPTGLNGLYAPRAEEALARAARDAGVPFVLSTASNSLLEDVRAASDGDLWLQLYVSQDRRIAEDLMRRARAAQFSTLMLTVDTQVHGKRDHDIRNGFRIPMPLTPRLAADVLTHPRWCWRMLRQGGSPQFLNLARSAGLGPGLRAQAGLLGRSMDTGLHWADLDWLRRHWPGRLVVKGVLAADDARLAAEHGADGIVVSNHGGRQLESAPSALQALPAIQAAASGMTVMVDGGVRRGADIAKACALGAAAVLLGRAPLYGLAARGARGAAEVLGLLRNEFETTLRLIGEPQAARLHAGVLAAGSVQRLQAL